VPQFLAEPDFAAKRDGQVCDGLLDLGTELVLMEYKASLLTLRAKFAGRADLLKDEIDSKFVGQGGDKKGVQQLASSIRKLVDGKKPKIESFDIKHYKTIIPVLVAYDIALTSPGIGGYLNNALHAFLKDLPESSPKIGHLIVLSTRDVECLEAISKKHKLQDVFGRYEREGGPALSFYDFLCNNYREDMQHPDTMLWEAVVEEFDEAGELFFGRKISAP
jgi:hypothetical protein